MRDTDVASWSHSWVVKAVSRVLRVGAYRKKMSSSELTSLVSCRPTASACSRPSSVRGTSPWWEAIFPCRIQCTRKGVCVLIAPHFFIGVKVPTRYTRLHETVKMHLYHSLGD